MENCVNRKGVVSLLPERGIWYTLFINRYQEYLFAPLKEPFARSPSGGIHIPLAWQEHRRESEATLNIKRAAAIEPRVMQEEKRSMKLKTWKTALILLSGLLWALPAAAQKGMGEPTGVARQAVKPPIETMSGAIKEIKTGPCERTTGRSLEGVHLIVQAESGKTINLHLGPATALENVLDQLSAGQQITFEAFHTDAMPQDAYVAKSLKAGDTTFDLRDDSLRPNWAIAARGGRGGGPGMGAGRGQGRGPGQGGGGCYW